MTDPIVLQATGDVKGPASSTDNSMVLFSGTSGKVIKGNNAVVTAAGLALLDDNNATEQRNTLGLGSMATQDSNAVTISGGQITGISRLYITTGDSNVPTAAPNTNTLQIANTAFVYAGLQTKANLSHLHDTSHITSGVLSVERGGTGVNTYTGWGSNVLNTSPALYGVPTAPTAAANTSTNQIATTAFVQSTLGIGYNQTWQSVSRTFGVDYINNTSRPIMFVGSFYRNYVSTANVDLIIDGVQVPLARNTNSDGGQASCGSLIIPPGATYRLLNVGEALSSYSCLELR